MNLPAAISLAAAVVGLVIAGLTFGLGSAPRWRRYRLLALIALLAALYCGLDVVATLDVSEPLVVRLGGLQIALGVVHVVLWMVYADRQLGYTTPACRKLIRGVMIAGATGWLVPGVFLDGAVTRFPVDALGVVYHYPNPTVAGSVVFALEVAFLAIAFVRFARAAHYGIDGARAHAAAIGIVLVAAAYDSLVTVGLFHAPYMLPVSFIGAVGAIGVLVTRAFVADARQLDAMTHRLEQLVDERTKELVAAEGALVRAEKLAALGQLSAGVAHEINNPAAAVAANLEYLGEELENGRVGDEAFACLDDSLQAIDRIARIVRQLLDIGRAAATAPESDATNVRRVVEQALGSARAALPETAAVSTEIDAELFVRADEASLVQILVNLITNAGQAVTGVAAGRVAVRAVESGHDVIITVTDNGVGMSEETKRRLFEPFYTTKPFGKGTGLGLSLSLGIVRSLGGELLVDARPGETTMRVRLPVASLPSPVSSGRLRARDRRRTLLLVEDDHRVRRALDRTLSSRFDVTVASGVDEAIGRVEEQPFDLILSDWKMPHGGGRRLYDHVAAHRVELLPRIVIMTGGVLSVSERTFLERRHVRVLPKPLAADALDAAVNEAESAVRRPETG